MRSTPKYHMNIIFSFHNKWSLRQNNLYIFDLIIHTKLFSIIMEYYFIFLQFHHHHSLAHEIILIRIFFFHIGMYNKRIIPKWPKWSHLLIRMLKELGFKPRFFVKKTKDILALLLIYLWVLILNYFFRQIVSRINQR